MLQAIRSVAVVEGGQVYFIRTDHIGRPVFATDSAGTKVWEASYTPFGEVETSTGSRIALRFTGQWFQSESGLHQNWMRDYDPTTGRYIQADPLGLVDGASVYGYALQNPGRYTDPTGEAIPLVLLWAIGGLIVGEIVEAAYEYCDCNSNVALERYAALGIYTEIICPTHPKSKRPFKGSRRHSTFSYLIGKSGLPKSSRGKMTRAARRAASRIPLLGTAMISYDVVRLTSCMAAR
ncbi:MAG: RHS repeat domain-containing protein [Paracoccaceae bacterium]